MLLMVVGDYCNVILNWVNLDLVDFDYINVYVFQINNLDMVKLIVEFVSIIFIYVGFGDSEMWYYWV